MNNNVFTYRLWCTHGWTSAQLVFETDLHEQDSRAMIHHIDDRWLTNTLARESKRWSKPPRVWMNIDTSWLAMFCFAVERCVPQDLLLADELPYFCLASSSVCLHESQHSDASWIDWLGIFRWDGCEQSKMIYSSTGLVWRTKQTNKKKNTNLY